MYVHSTSELSRNPNFLHHTHKMKEQRPTKRVRRSPSSSSSASSDDGDAPAADAMEIFRRHFESRFEAIEDDSAKPAAASTSKLGVIDDGAGEDEFDGLSSGSDSSEDEDEDEEDEEEVVQVVHHDTTKKSTRPALSKKEARAFMVGLLTSSPGRLVANTKSTVFEAAAVGATRNYHRTQEGGKGGEGKG
jgi:hypothetical protein